MSQARGLPQSKEALLKSYNKKLKDDIQSMLVNFEEIIKLARVSAPVPSQFPNKVKMIIFCHSDNIIMSNQLQINVYKHTDTDKHSTNIVSAKQWYCLYFEMSISF